MKKIISKLKKIWKIKWVKIVIIINVILFVGVGVWEVFTPQGQEYVRKMNQEERKKQSDEKKKQEQEEIKKQSDEKKKQEQEENKDIFTSNEIKEYPFEGYTWGNEGLLVDKIESMKSVHSILKEDKEGDQKNWGTVVEFKTNESAEKWWFKNKSEYQIPMILSGRFIVLKSMTGLANEQAKNDILGLANEFNYKFNNSLGKYYERG